MFVFLLLSAARAASIEAVYHPELLASGAPAEALLVATLGPAPEPLWLCLGAPPGWSVSLQQLLAGADREAAVPVNVSADPERAGALGMSCWGAPAARGPFGMAVFELVPPVDARDAATLRWQIGTSTGTADAVRVKSELIVMPMTEEQIDAGVPEMGLVWGRDEARPWAAEEAAAPSASPRCLKGGCGGWGQLDVMLYPDGTRHEGAWNGSTMINYGVDRDPDGRVTLAGFWSEGAVSHPVPASRYDVVRQAGEVARALAPLCADGEDLRRFLPAGGPAAFGFNDVTVAGLSAPTTLWTPTASDSGLSADQLALRVRLSDDPGDAQRLAAACSGAFAALAGAESPWRATSFRSPPCMAVLDEGTSDDEPAPQAPPRVQLFVDGMGDEIVLRCASVGP